MPNIETIKKIATKCYYRIMERESAKLSETCGRQGLSELEKLDIYQMFRDKSYDKFGSDMFWADFYDLFDKIYQEVKDEKAWESLVMC